MLLIWVPGIYAKERDCYARGSAAYMPQGGRPACALPPASEASAPVIRLPVNRGAASFLSWPFTTPPLSTLYPHGLVHSHEPETVVSSHGKLVVRWLCDASFYSAWDNTQPLNPDRQNASSYGYWEAEESYR